MSGFNNAAPIDNRTEAEEPQLFIDDCECGMPKCDRFILAMIRPVIKPLAGSDELVSMLYVPVEHAQGIVDRIRELARKKGRRIR